MSLFGGLGQFDQAYLSQRTAMASSMQTLTNRAANTPGQVFNDIEMLGYATQDGITGVGVASAGVNHTAPHHPHVKYGTDNTCTLSWVEYPTRMCKAAMVGKHTGANTCTLKWLNRSGVFRHFAAGRDAMALGATINPFEKNRPRHVAMGGSTGRSRLIAATPGHRRVEAGVGCRRPAAPGWSAEFSWAEV